MAKFSGAQYQSTLSIVGVQNQVPIIHQELCTLATTKMNETLPDIL